MFKQRLFLSLILIAIPASADVLQVQVSGAFDNLAPRTDFSSPGVTWELTFDVDSQPTPMSPGVAGFSTTGSNLEYDPSNKPVSGVSFATAGSLSFYVGGGFTASLQDSDGTSVAFAFDGQPLFTGGTSAPEILTGPFTVTGSDLDGFNGSPGAASITITDLSATPEPGSDLLLGTGLAGAALFFRRRRRLAASRN